MGGSVDIHIFLFCPTSFFTNQIQVYQFEKKSVGQNINKDQWIYTPLISVLVTPRSCPDLFSKSFFVHWNICLHWCTNCAFFKLRHRFLSIFSTFLRNCALFITNCSPCSKLLVSLINWSFWYKYIITLCSTMHDTHQLCAGKFTKIVKIETIIYYKS